MPWREVRSRFTSSDVRRRLVAFKKCGHRMRPTVEAAFVFLQRFRADQSDQHGRQRSHAEHQAAGEQAVQHQGFEFHGGSPSGSVRGSL
jgi:hypothetical protein